MRRIVATAVAVAAALLLQLTLINRLHLPGGGTPDLVLLLVAAVGLAGGPVPGMTTGFIAGLSLDLAASASQLIGEYALVFCLIGWACGRLRGTVARSAVLPIVIAAAAAAIGEVLVAVLGIALDPAQVTLAAVRQVLPAAVIYDMALSPFVLYLVLLVSASLSGPLAGVARPAGGGAAATALPGSGGLAGSSSGPALLGRASWLAGPPASRRARKQAARRGLRLGRGSARPGDGWVGGGPPGRVTPGQPRRPGNAPKLRPGAGVAGSAVAGQVRRALPARPVNLKLASGRRRGGPAGTGQRPGLPGGAGAGTYSAGRGLGLGAKPVDLRLGSSRRRGGVIGGGLLGAGTGTRRPAAQPKFRAHPGKPSRTALGGSAAGGVLDQQALRAIRRRKGRSPRLRLASGRRGDGVLGSPLAGRSLTGRASRPAPAVPRFRSRPLGSGQLPAGKHPRFGFGRLSFRARRRGGRARVWKIASKRTGGLR